MNERIKQLAKEAGMIYGQGNLDDFDMLTHMPKEVRFAELIVRECAKAAGDFEYARLHDSLVEDHVLKHFGVEE